MAAVTTVHRITSLLVYRQIKLFTLPTTFPLKKRLRHHAPPPASADVQSQDLLWTNSLRRTATYLRSLSCQINISKLNCSSCHMLIFRDCSIF